jgi:hypothetical protein
MCLLGMYPWIVSSNRKFVTDRLILFSYYSKRKSKDVVKSNGKKVLIVSSIETFNALLQAADKKRLFLKL